MFPLVTWDLPGDSVTCLKALLSSTSGSTKWFAIPCGYLVSREGEICTLALGMGDAGTKETPDLLSCESLVCEEIGELSRAQSALLGLLCPVNKTVSLCGLLLPLLVRMLCIHLTEEGVAIGLSLPQAFFSSLIINHFCACLPQEAESYSSVGPCLFSIFPVLSTVPGKKDVLKELLIHKKLIYEEYNFPEAVWDGGRTREIFFQFPRQI